MIEIANIQNSPLVEITISDKLTQEDMEEINEFFENKVKNTERVNVLLYMENWEGMTLKGLIEDFKMIKYIKNMNKAAIVADSKFLEADSKVENMLPGLSVEYFETDEKDEAKKWLEQ